MNTKRNVLIAGALTLLTALALVSAPITAPAQILTDFTSWRPIPIIRTADDTDVKLLVKYVGTNASGGTVTVSAAGDITLAQGAVGSSTADATLKCPSGGSNGVIDVSDASCNTLGEVINAINASSNWIAVPLDGLLSDDMNCGGSGCLKALSEATASILGGKSLFVETAVVLNSTIALVPPEARQIEFYVSGVTGYGAALRRNPFAGYRTFVASQLATSTYGAGTSAMSITTVAPIYTRASSTESATTLYGPIAGGATTVSKTFIALSDPVKVLADSDQKVILRLTNSAAMATVTHTVLGYRAPYPR